MEKESDAGCAAAATDSINAMANITGFMYG